VSGDPAVYCNRLLLLLRVTMLSVLWRLPNLRIASAASRLCDAAAGPAGRSSVSSLMCLGCTGARAHCHCAD